MSEYQATRATALALGEEQKLVRQGYDFLDEKRMLLAGKIMRQLEEWRGLRQDYADMMLKAREALGAAISEHGLEALQVHPVPEADDNHPATERRDFLGVTLIIVAPSEAVRKSLAVHGDSIGRCAAAFRVLLALAWRMAAASGNLHRLADEYARTERRASALENVLLPEIANALKTIEEQLEEVDQEEAIRVRLAGRKAG